MKSYYGIVYDLVLLAAPNIASFFVMFLGNVITVICVSELDVPKYLGAVGLGQLIGNMFGFSIGIGLTSVLDTLVAQAIGSGNQELASTQLSRARLISAGVAIPTFYILTKTESILLWLGQDGPTSSLAAAYVRYTNLGLLPSFAFFSLSSYLRAVQQPTPPLIINGVCTAMHVVLAILLINILGFGVEGAGAAIAISGWLRFLFLEIYVLWYSSGSEVLKGGSISLFFKSLIDSKSRSTIISGMGGFITLAIPSALLMLSEWWAYEIQALISGWISVDDLAANVVCANVVTVAYMVPVGIAQAAATLVGNSLGAGSPDTARKFAIVSAIFTLGVMAGIAMLMIAYKKPISRFYTSDEHVLDKLGNVIDVIGAFAIIDGLQGVLEGILRGLRMQTDAVRYKIIAMIAIRVPVGYILGLTMRLGVSGLWLGACAGMSFSSAVYLYKIMTCNWYSKSAEAIKDSQTDTTSSLLLPEAEEVKRGSFNDASSPIHMISNVPIEIEATSDFISGKVRESIRRLSSINQNP